jgi:hypothetical protein
MQWLGDATVDPSERNVFGLLDQIRARPAMYLRNSSLQDLESLLFGYYSCVGMHAIDEDIPKMNNHFLIWLHYLTDWSCSIGWAAAIEQRYPKQEEALTAFFEFLDEYRKLIPTRICTVKLGPKHKPTGKRVRYGFDGLMERPRRVDVIRYRPEPLHFLRFHYRDRVEDGWLLMTDSGSHVTSVAFAKRWVRDELQVAQDLWEPVKQT